MSCDHPRTPSVSVPSQPGRVPTPSASSLHVAEGPGLPQVSCLSNKVETLKTWVLGSPFSVRPQGGYGRLHRGGRAKGAAHVPSPTCNAADLVQRSNRACSARTTAGPALKAWPGVPHTPPCSSLAGFSSSGFSYLLRGIDKHLNFWDQTTEFALRLDVSASA